ncbi:mediator of RNA polymerase II transcription subunit 26c [Pyrus ussuriensis x Pyrus communis]|uniref:Mediator of RNA polymerase II transcription subunit 26c n=1 Tax=Pyrus ussuriensis x Pyrus communis TaxID=2448454 RepID=A0A5N5F5J6_9ROSA|nr:mediator of RNA polymerase II transcription subunit 26c [Pyrus ussuriensis x Pyrus communis]
MDHDDFRTILESSEVDIWTFMDTAIAVASADYGTELKHRRDGIVERLYATTSVPPQCPNCDADGPNGHNGNQPKAVSPYTPQSVGGDGSEEDEEELDPYAGLFDDEQKKILDIKKQLEDPYQSEETLVELLQTLADMEISVQELKEADIGKHVSQLRKQHPSDVVRRLAKQIVNKWKGIVNEWVKLHGEQQSSSTMVDEDSPQQKIPHNGLHQVPDFAYSPNPHNGSSGSDKNNSEPERKSKAVPRRDAPPKPTQLTPVSASAPQNRQMGQKESNFDSDRLASARRRLQANYKEAENAKKQRTIQVMDIHEIPKPKNSFIARNKGGGGGGGGGGSGSHQGRHW